MHFAGVAVVLLSTVFLSAHAKPHQSDDISSTISKLIQLLRSERRLAPSPDIRAQKKIEILQKKNEMSPTLSQDDLEKLGESLGALALDISFTVIMHETPTQMRKGDKFIFGITRSNSDQGIYGAVELGTFGTFTCKYPGTYFFTLSVRNNDTDAASTSAGIFKNDHYVVLAHASGDAQASASASVVLKAGDKVSVRCHSAHCSPLGEAYTSFSGFLAKPWFPKAQEN